MCELSSSQFTYSSGNAFVPDGVTTITTLSSILHSKSFPSHPLQLCNCNGIHHAKIRYYHKYPNLVRTQVEIISDPNYLVRILFKS